MRLQVRELRGQLATIRSQAETWTDCLSQPQKEPARSAPSFERLGQEPSLRNTVQGGELRDHPPAQSTVSGVPAEKRPGRKGLPAAAHSPGGLGQGCRRRGCPGHWSPMPSWVPPLLCSGWGPADFRQEGLGTGVQGRARQRQEQGEEGDFRPSPRAVPPCWLLSLSSLAADPRAISPGVSFLWFPPWSSGFLIQ